MLHRRVSFAFGPLVAALFASSAQAIDYSIGTGVSEAFGGRTTPSLFAGAEFSDFAFTLGSAGVRSTAYWESTYQMGAYYTFAMGDLFSRPVRAGLGVGGALEWRGYRESLSGPTGDKFDWVAGPAMRVVWDCWGPVFVSVDALLGLRSFTNFRLEFQQLARGVIGVRW